MHIKSFLIIVNMLFLLSVSLPLQAQTRRALVIGIGQQEDKAWGKINGDKDVVYVEAMLKAAKYKEVNITMLVNGQATKNGIVKAFKGLVSQCKVGDIVYVHYSGHGQQMKDVHNDEKDGLDECWIPYDAYRKPCKKDRGEKHLTDDEVVRGVEDIFDAIKSFIWGTSSSDKGNKKVVNPNAKENRERWITLSACRSDQVNVEMKSPAVGKLTYALWKELKNSDKVNNDEFMRRIRKFVNRNTSSRPQQPEMTGEDINKYNITDILSR